MNRALGVPCLTQLTKTSSPSVTASLACYMSSLPLIAIRDWCCKSSPTPPSPRPCLLHVLLLLLKPGGHNSLKHEYRTVEIIDKPPHRRYTEDPGQISTLASTPEGRPLSSVRRDTHTMAVPVLPDEVMTSSSVTRSLRGSSTPDRSGSHQAVVLLL